MPHIDIRDLGRLREISSVLVRHGFGHLVALAGLEGETVEAAPDAPFARRLRRVLGELGPTFVKLGQVLSVRPDIVPRAVIDELEHLQDNVPPTVPDAVFAAVEAELGVPIAERFSHFDPIPLASASIAQVHRATLPSGEEVAVKVQRPGIEASIRSDLHILYSLAQLITGRLTLPGLYTPVGIVREFEAAMHQELDFLQEARAATRFRQLFADSPDIVVPRIHEELSTRRLLVMELIDGEPFHRLSDSTDEARVQGAMDRLIEATYQQVFEHGFFHGDPHPGNLLVLADGRLAYLDFGLTGQLTVEMRDVVVALFVGLVTSDAETVALTLYRAGATEGKVDLKGFKREVERLMVKYHGATLTELSQTTSLIEFVETAARYRIRLVPEYVVLVRTASILDGIARRLLPQADIVHRVQPFAQRLVGDRLKPDRLSHDALRLLQHAQMAFQDVPLQLNQLMLDLEQGNLEIRTVDGSAEALRAEVRQAGMRVAVGLTAAALTLSGAILLTPLALSPELWAVPILIGAVGLVLGLTLILAMFAHYLVASRVAPAELRRQALAVLRFFLPPRRDR